jgi:hypothetical protein
VVEPDDDFVVPGESRERIVTRFQVLLSLLPRAVPGFGLEAGAGVPPRFGSEAGGAGPSYSKSPYVEMVPGIDASRKVPATDSPSVTWSIASITLPDEALD